ncbi:lysozyme [Sphingobium nicotianae]|uniref:Lysozyme n=1 Tax=Sphingobium nicotianae TaxID=2782607 RepID=A0A9X1IPL4_9SPHN|nr:lysozyme [Sphingobium nicotianae]MBT2186177.1 lysozyme [Sphingobium nicotianae]
MNGRGSQVVGALGGVLGGGGFIALAIALATPTVEKWEGTRTDPYRDPVGIWTVCTGETRVAMRRYTTAQCRAILQGALAGDYAPAVLKAVPALRDRPQQFAASISLAYNIGPAAFARSSVARHFNAGDWRGGCEAFLMWNRAGGRVVTGLDRRRHDERTLCLTGL